MCTGHGVEEKYVQNLVGKCERKRTFEKPRSRWEYNIKMNLKEIR